MFSQWSPDFNHILLLFSNSIVRLSGLQDEDQNLLFINPSSTDYQTIWALWLSNNPSSPDYQTINTTITIQTQAELLVSMSVYDTINPDSEILSNFKMMKWEEKLSNCPLVIEHHFSIDHEIRAQISDFPDPNLVIKIPKNIWKEFPKFCV